MRHIPKSKTPRAVRQVLSRGVFFCDAPHLTTFDNKLGSNRLWSVKISVCGHPIVVMLSGAKRSRNIYGCCYGLLDSSTSLRFAQNDRELRPLRPLRSRCRPIIVILSAAQRSRRISLKSLPLVAACRDHSTTLRYSQTTLNNSSPIRAVGRTQNYPIAPKYDALLHKSKTIYDNINFCTLFSF